MFNWQENINNLKDSKSSWNYFSTKAELKFLLHNKFHFWVSIVLLVLSLSLALIDIFILKFLPAKLPLFYSLPWGDTQLASHQQFLIIPATISSVVLLNLIISWQLHHSQNFFKMILFVSSIVIGIILTVSFIKIVINFI